MVQQTCYILFIPETYTASKIVHDINKRVGKKRLLNPSEIDEINDSLVDLINGEIIVDSDLYPQFIDSEEDIDLVDDASEALREILKKLTILEIYNDDDEDSYVNINSHKVSRKIDEIQNSCF